MERCARCFTAPGLAETSRRAVGLRSGVEFSGPGESFPGGKSVVVGSVVEAQKHQKQPRHTASMVPQWLQVSGGDSFPDVS